MATADVTTVPDVQAPRFRRPGWQFPWEMLPMLVFTIALSVAAATMIFAPDSAKMAILLPVAVVIGLTMLVRPELALIFSVAYTPFESNEFRPIALPGGLTISKILGAAIIGALLFNIIFRKRRFRFMDDSQDFAVLMFAAAILFSGIASAFPSKTMESASRLLRMLAFYFAVKNLLSSFPIMRGVMWAIALSATAATLFGINEFVVMSAIRNWDIRVRGVYMDVNDYAALVVFAVLVSVHLLEMVKSFTAKSVLTIALGIMLTGIVLSASRGAMLSLSIAMLIYIARHPRRNLILFICVISVVGTFPFWPASVKDRFFTSEEDLAVSENIYAETTEHSTERRAAYVVFGVSQIVQHPFTGLGYGTFSRHYPNSEFARFDNPLTDGERYRLAHNAYLEITFGAGLAGLIPFVAIWLISLRDLERARRGARRGSTLWGAANGFQLAMISLMIASFFLSIEHFNYTWIGLAVSSALAAYVRQKEANEMLRQTHPLPEPAI
jgi:O-antigen ligase